MRRLILAACLISIALPVYAAGNVLLPSSSNSSGADAGSGGVSNALLGLGGGTASSPPAAIESPAPATPPLAQTPVPAPAQTAPTAALSQSLAQMPKTSDIISPIDQDSAKNLPPGSIPTQVIHQQDMSQIMAQANASLPYGLTIAIGSRSVFGSHDVEDISSKLGLSRDQISSACSMSLQGVLQTSKGSYLFDGGLKSQAGVRYDGTIKSYLMSARAMCAVSGKLPPGSGFLTETGGRYMIPLQVMDCPAPNRQTATLTVTYDGSAKSQCLYQ